MRCPVACSPKPRSAVCHARCLHENHTTAVRQSAAPVTHVSRSCLLPLSKGGLRQRAVRCAKPPPRLPHRALYDLVRAAGAPAGSGGKDPKDPKAAAAMPGKVSALSRRLFLRNADAAIDALAGRCAPRVCRPEQRSGCRWSCWPACSQLGRELIWCRRELPIAGHGAAASGGAAVNSAINASWPMRRSSVLAHENF